MGDDWDIPPFPTKGNRSQAVLFAAIGRALNAWEEIEIALAHLHAAFVTGDRFESNASHTYGAPNNFRERFKNINAAAVSILYKIRLRRSKVSFSDCLVSSRDIRRGGMTSHTDMSVSLNGL